MEGIICTACLGCASAVVDKKTHIVDELSMMFIKHTPFGIITYIVCNNAKLYENISTIVFVKQPFIGFSELDYYLFL